MARTKIETTITGDFLTVDPADLDVIRAEGHQITTRIKTWMSQPDAQSLIAGTEPTLQKTSSAYTKLATLLLTETPEPHVVLGVVPDFTNYNNNAKDTKTLVICGLVSSKVQLLPVSNKATESLATGDVFRVFDTGGTYQPSPDKPAYCIYGVEIQQQHRRKPSASLKAEVANYDEEPF